MDELTFARPADLTDEEWTELAAELEAHADLRYQQVLAARAFAPHVVKHNVQTDPDGNKHDTVTECPDCTRGLIAVGDALVCYDLRRYAVPIGRLKTTHHDIIACGRTG